VLDHTCHNEDESCLGGDDCPHRACCNPAHLDPCTRGENVLRGKGTTAQRARQTECIHGHPFDEANTYRAKSGRRNCRTCANKRSRDAWVPVPPKTHCKYGHPLDQVRRDGRRRCSVCGARAAREYRARKKAAA
jgi:hypothetical protein